ncbi:MAG: TetR/AcrR family transcriptional regulator [Candidatus Nanopelagicales bacterium]
MALTDVGVAIPEDLAASDELDRREHLMAAAARVLVRDGSAGMRVRDVAVEAGVSTGIVHYYFGSKDEMLVDALRWAIGKPAERFADIRRDGDHLKVLATLLEVSLPHPGVLFDEYVLWLELWTAVTHDSALQPLCEELAADYREELLRLVIEGTEAGAFHPVAAPEVVAERISAMVDGLCFRTIVGYSWTPLERVRDLLRSFACEQLGVRPEDLPEIHLSRRQADGPSEGK